ncbi:DUF736 domain-containing protein [Novosphingobium lubricantis]|uniref:DUF736 domain-containing protein n=1 Tax=Novosphingobium sp. CCH12-A3 TaxID=1768752 RepID=UPI00078075CA|nr:DUF736 domain-containing protein [Novosphingobium sp. CCH12-A3]
MNIGEVKLNRGRLMGWIATRTIDLPRLGLRPVESDAERPPAYEILALNVGDRWVQVGALWEETSQKGEVYYQGYIDDPSMPEKLPIALFGTDAKGYQVAWRRDERRDDFGPATRSARRETPSGNGEDYGFGGSTADDSGRLATEGAGADLDDEIQF